ncbi:hypothetical protein GQ44DRAFT_437007 [Phaeosphaeriaceae sp. PMI808]|nr:hypothetical protein GQ44DRAFT_437007 [Phaeosphaeriaceae sp. PMI808]
MSVPDCQQTPTQGPEDNSKGALLITAVELSSIEDPTCPICREPYSGADGAEERPEADQEDPVSIDMVAEWFGSRRCCGHVIGRSCLFRHLTAPGAWANKCPLCRDVWFHETLPEDTQPGEQQQEQTNPTSPSAHMPRRSTRIAGQVGERRGSVHQNPSRAHMSDRHGISRVRLQQRPQARPPRFTRQLLAALDVKDGSNEVMGTIDDVEKTLEAFYRGLE